MIRNIRAKQGINFEQAKAGLQVESSIVSGRNPVLEYLRGGEGEIRQLFMSAGASGKPVDEALSVARTKKIKVLTLNKSEFLKRFGDHAQGIALELADIPLREGIDFEAVAKRNGTILILDQISDPHNLGAIIRSAEALGCDGIVITRDNSCPVNATVIKSAAGATAYIAIEQVQNLAQFIDKIKKIGFWVIGTTDHATTPIRSISKIRPAACIIGSEGKGMRRLTEEKCDYTVSIPMKGKVSSLNASVAAGILLFSLLESE